MKGGFGCSPCCSPPNDCVITGPMGFDAATNVTWLAQRFTTPAGGLTLSSVTVYMDGGQTLTDASRARLKLYSNVTKDSGDPEFPQYEPLSLIATLTAPASVSTTMTFTLADEPLTGSTMYWLVMHVIQATGRPTGNLRWQYMFEGEGCVPSAQTYSSDGGGNWFPTNLGTPYRYAIN